MDGRPSLGDRVQVNVRLPRSLRDRIDEARGHRSRDAWVAAAAEAALDPVVQYQKPELQPNVHRHMPQRPLRTEFRAGVKIKVYECECGGEVEVA